MATAAQTHANRENAKKSTGPRTPEGKAASSRNSLVHGMTSGKFLPPDGDPDEFFHLLHQYRQRFQPFDEIEDNLVERLAAAEFKMRSVRYMDAGLFHYQAATNPMPERFNLDGRLDPKALSFHNDSKYYNSFTKLIRYEGALQREFSRAMRDLRLLQEDRRKAETQPQPPVLNPQPREQSSPQPPEARNTNRTQFPGAADPSGRQNDATPLDPPQNPDPNPSPGGPC